MFDVVALANEKELGDESSELVAKFRASRAKRLFDLPEIILAID